MDTKTLIGLVTIAIGVVSYSFYFRDIFRGKTKPEAYSWLIWSVLATITFFAQRASGAGPGAWATLLTAVVCLMISLIAFKKRYAHLKIIDVVSLVGALIALGLWCYTSRPLLAVVLVVIIGACGFVPTLSKAYRHPLEETATTFALNALKFLLAIFALDTLAPVTWLYPASLVVMNSVLVTLITLRRR